jgi:hypothetical protein
VPLTAILERTMCDHYDIQYITDMLLFLEWDVLYKFLIMNTRTDTSSLIRIKLGSKTFYNTKLCFHWSVF